jgi:hypothetical protein
MMNRADASSRSASTVTLESEVSMATNNQLELPRTMGRKKGERKTVMVRTYEDFAEKVKQAAGERGMTAAEFCGIFLAPCVERAHRDYINAESKKLSGGSK